MAMQTADVTVSSIRRRVKPMLVGEIDVTDQVMSERGLSGECPQWWEWCRDHCDFLSSSEDPEEYIFHLGRRAANVPTFESDSEAYKHEGDPPPLEVLMMFRAAWELGYEYLCLYCL